MVLNRRFQVIYNEMLEMLERVRVVIWVPFSYLANIDLLERDEFLILIESGSLCIHQW